MSERMFNPGNPEYKRVGDLPKEERKNFANEDGGGFVRKEAKEEFDDVKKIVELAKLFKEADIDVKELLDKRMKSRMTREIGEAIKDNKTAMDIMQERAEEEILKPIDIIHAEANEIHSRKYPERLCLEKLRNNPDDLKGIPRVVWANKEFAMEAVKLNRKALHKVRGCTKEIVLEAVKHDGMSLQYAYDRFRADKDVVLEAARQNPSAIKFASRDIKTAIKKLLLKNL